MTQANQNSATAPAPLAFSNFDPTAMMQAFTARASNASVSGGNPAAGWLELQQHGMTFLSDRFKQDANLFHRLGTCTNPSDMAEACTDYAKRATEDYQSHVAKITTLGQQVMTNADVSGEAKVRPNRRT
ncbi:MAG: hypothetical protein V7661_04200 [Sulfitobacter sp.]